MSATKQYIAGASAAFGSFCLGASMGWSGPVEKEILTGVAYKFTPSLDNWGWASSLLTLGAACICVPIGLLIAAFGRKLVMLVLIAPYLMGWAYIIGAQHVSMLLIGRFVIGACGGAFCVTAPIYTTEIADLRTRGVMGCFFQLFIVSGIFYGFFFGSFFNVLVVNILCAILPIIFFVAFIWMPESPVFLVQKGKIEKAEKAMKWLRGKDADISDEMNAMIADSKKERLTCGQALSRRTTLKGLFISVMLMMFQQMCGINAIIFYATGIFEEAGTGMTPSTCTIIIGIVGIVAMVPAMLFIEKAGRRILLLISAALLTLTTLTLGIYFKFLRDSKVGWLPVLAVCIFVTGFSMGFGPVTWLLMAELFAEDVKPFCGSIAGTVNWIAAFAVTKLFPICLQSFGPAITFWIFAAIGSQAFLFILFIVPETKGKTLDQIQIMLGGDKAI